MQRCSIMVAALALLSTLAFVTLQRAKAAAAPADPQTLRLLDLDGRPVDPFATNGPKAIVFVFVSNDCPISNRYLPEIRRLHERFAPRGVAFWIVHPNADETVEAIRDHARDYQYPCLVLRDSAHALVKLARVTITPEAAVFLRPDRLVYHGRIDDRHVDFGKARPNPTQRDLADALDAVLQGKKVRSTSPPGIGCPIFSKEKPRP